jgi:hypothetical protein
LKLLETSVAPSQLSSSATRQLSQLTTAINSNQQPPAKASSQASNQPQTQQAGNAKQSKAKQRNIRNLLPGQQ